MAFMSVFKELVKEFAENSTTHGLGDIYRTKSKFIRALWILCFLVSSGYCFYQLAISVLDYLTYSTISKYHVTNEIPMLFPAVDVCVLNAYDANKVQTEIAKLKSTYPNILDLKRYPYFIQSIDYLSESVKANLESMWENQSNPESRQIANQFTLNQILVSCRFQESACFPDNFTYFHSFEFGACYSFNSGFNSPVKIINQAGEKFGLQLELFAGDPNQQVQNTYLNGFRIIVHNQSVDSFVQEDGQNIPVGRQFSIAIQRNFISYLPLPYNDCIEENFNDFYQNDLIEFIKTSMNKTTYSRKYCQKICTQLYAIKKCGCYDYSLPHIPNYKNDNLRVYGCFSDRDLTCLEYNYNILFENFLQCDQYCLMECNPKYFSKLVTMGTYPTTWYANQLLKSNGLTQTLINNNLNSSILSLTYLQNTVSKVNIFYQNMIYTSVTESPASSLSDLISFIGGNLGLFLGMSFLSLVEVIDILIQLIRILIRKVKNSGKIKNQVFNPKDRQNVF